MHSCNVVAEISNTHIGLISRAKELINLAKLADADYVKFQKRNPDESTPEHLKNKPHPNQIFSYGKTYLEHRKKIELSIEQHIELYNYCNSINIKYATSVWDITSAKQIIFNINPDYIKVPSACNQYFNLMNILIKEYDKDVHISTGMITYEEIDKIVDFFDKNNAYKRLVLYHCTSEYPCPFEDICLSEISRLKNTFHNLRIGFSDHGKGIINPVVAYVLGAEWAEMHFIDDRTFKHTDASNSLEPDGLRRVCRDIKVVNKVMTYKTGLSKEEIKQKNKLRFLGI